LYLEFNQYDYFHCNAEYVTDKGLQVSVSDIIALCCGLAATVIALLTLYFMRGNNSSRERGICTDISITSNISTSCE
jgi:hypothetical protein